MALVNRFNVETSSIETSSVETSGYKTSEPPALAQPAISGVESLSGSGAHLEHVLDEQQVHLGKVEARESRGHPGSAQMTLAAKTVAGVQ